MYIYDFSGINNAINRATSYQKQDKRRQFIEIMDPRAHYALRMTSLSHHLEHAYRIWNKRILGKDVIVSSSKHVTDFGPRIKGNFHTHQDKDFPKIMIDGSRLLLDHSRNILTVYRDVMFYYYTHTL